MSRSVSFALSLHYTQNTVEPPNNIVPKKQKPLNTGHIFWNGEYNQDTE